MQSTLVSTIGLDNLNPFTLWGGLDAETRTEAARALYSRDHDDHDARHEADQALAEAMRFRLVAVRKLPIEKRAARLAALPRLDESLVSALLIALHVARRRPMLAVFLDHLGIPHNEGVIDGGYEPEPHNPESLSKAVDGLLEEFPIREVEVYLATLMAMDPDTWDGLARVFQE